MVLNSMQAVNYMVNPAATYDTASYIFQMYDRNSMTPKTTLSHPTSPYSEQSLQNEMETAAIAENDEELTVV